MNERVIVLWQKQMCARAVSEIYIAMRRASSRKQRKVGQEACTYEGLML